MPFYCGAPPAGEEAEPLVEERGDLGRTHRRDSRRGQLDREGDAIEPLADLGDRAGVRRVDRELGNGSLRAFREQPDGRTRGHIVDGRGLGHAERAKRPDLLSLDGETLAACCEDADAAARVQHGFGQQPGVVEQVLAVVEHQQQFLGAEELDNALFERHVGVWLHAERGRDHLHERFGIARRRELAQPRTVGETREHLGRHLRGEARLAHAAHPDERDQAGLVECLRDAIELVVAADERRELERQVARVCIERSQRREVLPEIGSAELEHPLGTRQVTQAMLAEVKQRGAVRDRVAEQLSRRERDEHLAAVRSGRETRRAIDRGTEVVAIAVRCRAGVYTHAHAQRTFWSLDVSKRDLTGGGGRDRVVGRAECGVQPVAGRLDHVPAVRLDRCTQQLVVTRQRTLHRLGVLVPQAC